MNVDINLFDTPAGLGMVGIGGLSHLNSLLASIEFLLFAMTSFH